MDVDPIPQDSLMEEFPGAAATFGQGRTTFLQRFDDNQFLEEQHSNLYYPFASHPDWELGVWLTQSGLSMVTIDSLLSLELMKTLPISFRMAQQLWGIVELLPSGPEWCYHELQMKPTKSPVRLFYCDTVQCLKALFNHPLFHDKMDLIPHCIYQTTEHLVHMYSKWITGDVTWQMQSKLEGATLLGVILLSDKTNISALIGDQYAHPLLIGLMNIHMSTCVKLSSDAFLLATLLPIPKFIHRSKHIQGLLSDRLIHKCLDIVLTPLKTAAHIGIMMNDPVGNLRHCYTPLTSYIVNTPKGCMLAGVGGKMSPVMTTMYI
ncbi:hypothetical protein JVU11DRAFT_9210 [Chiua virens]|nr:hypothetical protein JVU11DRAFT_9210 [Chiua virens]